MYDLMQALSRLENLMFVVVILDFFPLSVKIRRNFEFNLKYLLKVIFPLCDGLNLLDIGCFKEILHH